MADIRVDNYLIAALFLFLTSMLFSLLGLFNALYAKSFDDIMLIPNFVITPLIYLGGVFYPLSILPQFWQVVSQFNPVLYMIDGLRFAFIGHSDVNIMFSVVFLVLCNVIFIAVILRMLRK